MKELLIIVLLVLLTACVPLENEATPTVIDSRITEMVKLPPKSTETPTPAKLMLTPAAFTPTHTMMPSLTTTPTLPPHITSMNVQVFPDGGGWLSANFSTGAFIPGRAGLWHTKDDGASWTNVLPPEVPGWRYAVLDSQHAWIYGKTFFQRTTNGGETWESLDPMSDCCENGFGWSIHFTDMNNGWEETTDVATGSYFVTLRTTQDGGKTWNFVDLKAPYPENQQWKYTLKLSNLCDDRFYFSYQRQMIIHGSTASCDRIYGDHDTDFPNQFGMDVTTNLGQTWMNISIPWTTDISKYKDKYPNVGILPGMPVFFNDRDGILPFAVYDLDKQYTKIPDTKIRIYHTYDGGMHWVSSNVELRDADPYLQALSPKIFIVTCAGELCITRDGAHTWQKIPFGHGDPYGFSFINPMVGLVLTMDGFPGTTEYQFLLWKTNDGGANWIQVPISPPSA